MEHPDRPIFDLWPALGANLPWLSLGELPTPVEPLDAVLAAAGAQRGRAWVKRDDLTSPRYGGNKVRTLEVLLADARAKGSSHIVATGAYGSNHVAATLLHADRAGLLGGAIVFPQPHSGTACANLAVTLAHSAHLVAVPHWSALPFGMAWSWIALRRRGHRATIMLPGGATPLGALGYVSAALELARQVERGELPAPDALVIAVGSTCTSAGLLLGLSLAARRGIGFRTPPRLVAVRITPWPVTAPRRIIALAARTGRLLARLTGDADVALPRAALRPHLTVDGRYLGAGYGEATPTGLDAIACFAAHPLPLDTTYSGKSGAALLDLARHSDERLLFWATKSSAPLPPTAPTQDEAPPSVRVWLARCDTGT